jgi:predicted Zn-dependent protease
MPYQRKFLGARIRTWGIALVGAAAFATACGPQGGGGQGQGQGQGPGHRNQPLALSPDQEVALGLKAYTEILSEAGDRVEPADSPDTRRVRRVGERIARVAESNKPLQREINLHLEGYRFAWDFHVIRSRQVNAFCLPGGKVAVFTGLLPVAENDDQLATVMSHEIAHALAHHASERVARAEMQQRAREAMSGSVGRELAGVLAAGAGVSGLKYNRMQESEADHIGIFLMTFAGYDPDEAVRFWERMTRLAGGGNMPEILSDHPSNAKRITQLRQWAPQARAAKEAFDEGRVDTRPRR